jgi:hypothetical protein
MLEARNLLSTFTVDHLADDLMGNGLNGSLRYCMTNAADEDDIQFGDGVTGTINLTRTLPDLTHSITIQGPSPDQLTVRRDTGGNYRIFTVHGGITVGIGGLTIANGAISLAGGGISNSGTLTLINCTVSGNSVLGSISGGGIYNDGMLTLDNSTVSDNSAASGGGGVFNNGALTLNSTTVSGNSSTSGSGGIGNAGTLTLNQSTVSGNSGGARGGGGIRSGGTGTLTLNNSTVSGNSAGPGGTGGGIRIEEAGTLTARNTVIASNTAPTAPDLSGNLGSQGYNLIGNTQGGSGFDPTDLLNMNPLLGSLQDNGGPTQTMALLAGSPAIDAGDNTGAPMWDQRGPGFPRIEHGIIDIGAFEYHFRQPQLDPNPVPVQGLSPPGPTSHEFLVPAEQPVDVARQESGGATVQPGQRDTTPKPATMSGALPARDAVLEAWSDPLANALAGL